MGKGQQAQVSDEAQNQFNNATAQSKAVSSLLMPAYQTQLQNPGYTDAQKTAITGATEGGIGAAFGSAAEGAANRAARTNNQAGLTSSMDELARERMRTSGALGAQNETAFANNAQGQTAQAESGLSGLFGQNNAQANTGLGIQSQNAQTPGFWQQFGSSVANNLGKAVVPSYTFGNGVSFG